MGEEEAEQRRTRPARIGHKFQQPIVEGRPPAADPAVVPSARQPRSS